MGNKGGYLRRILTAIGDWFVNSISKGSRDYYSTIRYLEEIEHVTPKRDVPDIYRKGWW